jgi:hypothetical protein
MLRNPPVVVGGGHDDDDDDACSRRHVDGTPPSLQYSHSAGLWEYKFFFITSKVLYTALSATSVLIQK